MNASPSSSGPVKPPVATAPVVPLHWTAEQALTVWRSSIACKPYAKRCGPPTARRCSSRPGATSSSPTANRLRSVPTSRSDAAATTKKQMAPHGPSRDPRRFYASDRTADIHAQPKPHPHHRISAVPDRRSQMRST